MEWLLLSSLMFVSSILLYLGTRKIKDYEIATDILNLFLFLIPTILCLVTVSILNHNLFIDAKYVLLIIIVSIIVGFLGNIFSLKGMQTSSNPGFSLIIQKGYASFTIFLSAILFQSELTIIKIVGTFIVLFSIYFISIDNKVVLTKVIKQEWFKYTLIAYFCFGVLSLFSKFILNQGISPFVYLFYYSLIVSLIGLIRINRSHIKFKITKTSGSLLIFIGTMSFLFNIFMNLAVNSAPNVGYVNTINAASIAALTIISSILFKDELNNRKIFGVLGVLIGLIIIFI